MPKFTVIAIALSTALSAQEAPKRNTDLATDSAGRPRAASAGEKPAAQSQDAVALEEFVVTGVFTATSVQEATASISTITASTLADQVPVSAADVLLNVPGVFVNSSLGEIRGMVYSRGVSVNTSDGANGYYYVSMQEDGLPITNVNLGNFGPDYFLRPDASLLRVEAVRGGSASPTGASTLLQYIPIQPRAYFVSATYKF